MDNGTPLAANANSVQDLIFALLENVFQFLQTKAHSFDSGKKLERRTLVSLILLLSFINPYILTITMDLVLDRFRSRHVRCR